MHRMKILAGLALVTSAAAAIAGDAALLPPSAWEIGPIIRGRNYSVGMPLHPTAAREGWTFDFPYPSVERGHVHYVTFNHGSLAGKTKIVMRYRVESAPGVRFVPRERPDLPGTLTLFFQRRGDNWTARGAHEAYRWYAPAHTVSDIRPGEHQIEVSLNDDWAAVMTSSSRSNPEGFRDALENAEKVGFVLGARVGGYGHGVFATGPARFRLISFEVL